MKLNHFIDCELGKYSLWIEKINGTNAEVKDVMNKLINGMSKYFKEYYLNVNGTDHLFIKSENGIHVVIN